MCIDCTAHTYIHASIHKSESRNIYISDILTFVKSFLSQPGCKKQCQRERTSRLDTEFQKAVIFHIIAKILSILFSNI